MKAYTDWVKAKFFPKIPNGKTQLEWQWVRSTGFIPEDDEDKALISKFLGMITIYKKVKK